MVVNSHVWRRIKICYLPFQSQAGDDNAYVKMQSREHILSKNPWLVCFNVAIMARLQRIEPLLVVIQVYALTESSTSAA